jgi:hypothetical protein
MSRGRGPSPGTWRVTQTPRVRRIWAHGGTLAESWEAAWRADEPRAAAFRSAPNYTGVAFNQDVAARGPPEGNSGESRDRALEASRVGAWRRLVAHTLGVRVVAGSNPAAPTNLIRQFVK